jgi:dTDP-4-amino-4,6-dideoxygalactose transaminase
MDANYKKLICLSKSCLGDTEKKAVLRVLDREFLGMGEEVHQFESELSEFVGRQVVCVGNGTAALQLALQACGIGDGDEVLVQSLTYVASFQAISATGANPVACDVDPETFCLDWRDAEKRLTPKTKAVMPVHYSGGVGKLNAIYAFADKYGLRVIEDAAHAFGTKYIGKIVGSFGDIACFSFDGIKNITSGEGGCIITDDMDVLKRIKDARLLGVEKDTEQRYSGKRSWEFDVKQQGWRYHMSNIMAAIGSEQLKRFPEIASKRQTLAKYYDSLFEINKSQIVPLKIDYETVVPHIYPVRTKGLRDRKLLRQNLLDKGIQTGVHYQPNHWLSYFHRDSEFPLPITESIFPELLSLPLHPGLSERDLEFVATTLVDKLKINCG